MDLYGLRFDRIHTTTDIVVAWINAFFAAMIVDTRAVAFQDSVKGSILQLMA